MVSYLALRLFLLIALFNPSQTADLPPLGDPNWQCGSDETTREVAEASILTHCPEQKEPVNNCCIAHDKCYDDQLGQEFCDETFCKCLEGATLPSKTCSEDDGPLFCTLVKMYGTYAYDRAGSNETESENNDAFYDYEAAVGKNPDSTRQARQAILTAFADSHARYERTARTRVHRSGH